MEITRKTEVGQVGHNFNQGNPSTDNFYDTFYMESQSNQPLSRLGEGDIGGDWTLKRSTDRFINDAIPKVAGAPYGGNYYAQLVYPGQGWVGSSIDDVASTSTVLDGLGTTAIARCIPTNPYEKLGTAVAEQLGAPIPGIFGHQIWKDKALTLKNSGSEYLNYEFGWLPLIDDVRKTAYAVSHAGKLLREFHRGSGKKTRVGYHFPVERWTRTFTGSIYCTGGAGPFAATGSVTEELSRETWFKGCFTYYVPSGTSPMEKLARAEADANHLLGLRLTPELLWDATPWSWAADWFGNVGDVLHNVGAFSHDGLVMQYGYVMQHSKLKRTMDVPLSWRTARVETFETKLRRHATPYGFNVDLHSLSLTQISILTALGLTHGLPGHG